MHAIVNTLLFVFLFGVALASRFFRRKFFFLLPPGPKPLPFVGNMFDIPKSHASLKYTEWQKVYGDIMHLNILGYHIVIINTKEIAEDLLEKRSRIYSSRPLMPVLAMTGWDFLSVSLPYGAQWKQHRKAYTQSLRSDAIKVYRPLQCENARILLCNLLENPDRHQDHVKLFTSAVILKVAYGHQIVYNNDRLKKVVDEAVSIVSRLVLHENIINLLPSLISIIKFLPSWFPGAGIKCEAARCKRLTQELLRDPIEVIKQNMLTDGTVEKSIASALLNHYSAQSGSAEQDDSIVRAVTATAYVGGLDTTSAVLSSFIFAMMVHPEAQNKARLEIISVVGSHRLPTFDDRKSLPYVNAVYRETMRCYPAAPRGLGHMTTEDDMYNEYTIPAGTIVLPNIWGMTHNEEIYPDPHVFKPERFLEPDGSLNEDDRILTYGFGRRICPGRFLAENTVWIAMASVLCALNISPSESDCCPVDIRKDFTGEIFSRPKPFKCIITVRDAEMSQIIHE